MTVEIGARVERLPGDERSEPGYSIRLFLTTDVFATRTTRPVGSMTVRAEEIEGVLDALGSDRDRRVPVETVGIFRLGVREEIVSVELEPVGAG